MEIGKVYSVQGTTSLTGNVDSKNLDDRVKALETSVKELTDRVSATSYFPQARSTDELLQLMDKMEGLLDKVKETFD
jgi:hypothetical protein